MQVILEGGEGITIAKGSDALETSILHTLPGGLALLKVPLRDVVRSQMRYGQCNGEGLLTRSSS